MSETTFSLNSTSAAAFRNVSACNRCRLRKNRCDQQLPACVSCQKAGAKCVGYDPITRREIPRSYVYFLESRLALLESEMTAHDIPVKPAEAFDFSSKPSSDRIQTLEFADEENRIGRSRASQDVGWNDAQKEHEKFNKLVSNVGSVSVQGASDPHYLSSTSGVSFARVVFAAVKNSLRDKNETDGTDPASTTSVDSGAPRIPANFPVYQPKRDSFFPFTTRSAVADRTPLPDKAIGVRFAEIYFTHANPKFPILHKDKFFSMLNIFYAIDERSRTPKESFFISMVFAIGARIENSLPGGNKSALEKYYTSAVSYMEEFMTTHSDAEEFLGDQGLDELQAILLLASFALLKPISPGLWYIVGVAVRLAVDLDLHHEGEQRESNSESEAETPTERGRKLWVLDMRRRLFWCTYSLERLVAISVGRPFSLADDVITTGFPSPLDDSCISPRDITSSTNENTPSYKKISIHYFELRLLQSEMLQVIQYRRSQSELRVNKLSNIRQVGEMLSPFLQKAGSFRIWKRGIDNRLWKWKEGIPDPIDLGVNFPIIHMELEYWKSVIMLYRQSIAISSNESRNEMNGYMFDFREDEDHTLLAVAEAGSKVIQIYRQLHENHLVLYSYLDTNDLFIAGISYLYAIWHSPIVRSRLTMDEVDISIAACTTVLEALTETCPPAENCRDGFDRMAKATVQMCMSTTGFGSSAQSLTTRPPRVSETQSSSTIAGRKRERSTSPSEARQRQDLYFQTSSNLGYMTTAWSGESSLDFGMNSSMFSGGISNADTGLGGNGWTLGVGSSDSQGMVPDLFEGFFFGSGNDGGASK